MMAAMKFGLEVVGLGSSLGFYYQELLHEVQSLRGYNGMLVDGDFSSELMTLRGQKPD